MFDVIKGFTEQIVEYSTIFGQLWYLCVFVFRGFVVVTIGGDVYDDEQSEFLCSTEVTGCTNYCFTKFTKISHIRFWGFQLLAIATPAILFHVFVVAVKGRIEKMKSDEKQEAEDTHIPVAHGIEELHADHHKRRHGVGKVHMKKIYDEESHKLKEVTFTDSISVAYFVNVIARCALEGVFIYLSYILFKFTDEDGPLDFIFYSVPALFKCGGEDAKKACYQHLAYAKNGYVPCWVSRPWEKTIFLRYMNIFSAICFLLSALEFVYLIYRGARAANRRQDKKWRRETSVRFAASTPHHNNNDFRTLAVPVDLDAITKQPGHGGYYVSIPENQPSPPARREVPGDL